MKNNEESDVISELLDGGNEAVISYEHYHETRIFLSSKLSHYIRITKFNLEYRGEVFRVSKNGNGGTYIGGSSYFNAEETLSSGKAMAIKDMGRK